VYFSVITYILAVALIDPCSPIYRRFDVHTSMYSTDSTYRPRDNHVDTSVAYDTESRFFNRSPLFVQNHFITNVTCAKGE
jgi:hypothetical protein